MRFEHEGMALWFDTPDAPAPKVVAAGKETTVMIGVKPTDTSNKIEVLYRVNQGSNQGSVERVHAVHAKWRRNDAAGKSYFSAVLPGFRAGDTVEYTAVCRCAGRQLPSQEEAFQSAVSFTVVEARNDENDGKVKTQDKTPNQPNIKSAGEKAGPAHGQLQHRTASTPAKALNAAGSNANDEKGRGGNDRTSKVASAQASPKSYGARGSSVATEDGGLRPQAESDPAVALSEPNQLISANEENDEAGMSMPSENGNKNGESYSPRTSRRMETAAGDDQSDDDNVTTDLAVELDDAEMILASTYDIEPPENNFQIRGKLSGGEFADGEKFDGHSVAVSFRRKTKMKDDEEEKHISVSEKVEAEVYEDGSFTLLLPDKSKLESALTIKVLAPDGGILRHEKIFLAALQGELRLEVEPKRRRKIKPRDGRERRESRKFRGQVRYLDGKGKVVNRKVNIWARRPEENEFQLVFSADTDSQGYFFGECPHGKFAEAYGVVAVAGKEKVPVRLKKDGFFDCNVILGITKPEAGTADEDCSCKAVVPRCPDSEELVRASGTYSVDLGSNGCVNFTAPNRTLEEFSFYSVVRSTDPEIKAFHLPEPGKLPDKLREKLASLGKGEEARKKKKQLLDHYREDHKARFKTQQEKNPGRGPLNARNAVAWDSEDEVPGFYQATTIAHGHLLHFKQIWKADGYSLGDLLYSLPLAPCQKKQIAVVDWQRQEKNKREERQKAGDEMEAELSRDRDISEIVKSALSEEMEGGSSATTSSVGGGLGGIIGPVAFGVSGGYSNSNSEAWQESARNLAASSLQQLSDKTKQSASSLRTQRSTVVQTVGQKEDVKVTTEVIANHNHCHAMTVEYFEVLRHFRVEQELVAVQECLFVPLLMSRFDFAKAQRWRDTLRRCLRKEKLKEGFHAINLILDNFRGSNLPEGRYSQEALEYLYGEFKISFHFTRPRDGDEGEFIPENWEPLAFFLGNTPQEVFEQHLEFTGGRTGESLYFLGERIKITGFAEYWQDKKPGERDQMFQNRIAPWLARGVLEKMQVVLVREKGNTEVKLDLTLVAEYEHDRPLHVSARLTGRLPDNISRESVLGVRILLPEALPSSSRVTCLSGTMHYRIEYMSYTLFDGIPINADVNRGNPIFIDAPLDKKELANPRAELRQKAAALRDHLNEYLVFYHLCLFRNMHRQHLYMLLDGFEIAVFDGERRTRRSLASVIENRMIGIAGNSLIFPVASGYHLDPTFEVEGNEAVDLFSHYAPTTPVPPMRISVPTPGVYAEAVMGKCNSCEVKDDTRFWRWQESPCGDEPAAIQAPSTESRRAEPPSLAPTPLAQPIISMQTAPEAPAPTGLASAMQLIGTPNLFKDITGLDLNQQNAMAALSASLETAKSFGNMALQLEQQKLANQAQLDQQKLAQQSQSQQQQAIVGSQSSVAGGSSQSSTSGSGLSSVEEQSTPMQTAEGSSKASQDSIMEETGLVEDGRESVDLPMPSDSSDTTLMEGVPKDIQKQLGGTDIQPSEIQLAVALSSAVKYDRVKAVAYARKYWNLVCNDGFVKKGVRIPKDKYGDGIVPRAKFKPVFDGSTFKEMEFAVDKDGKPILGGTIEEQWRPLFDCTHFVSCCIGEPHGNGFHIDETTGGLPIWQNWSPGPPNNPYGISSVDFMVRYLTSSDNEWKSRRGNRPPFAKLIGEKMPEDEAKGKLKGLKIGDLIAYWKDPEDNHIHMTIYLGNGKIACHTYCRSDQPACTWDNDWNIKFGAFTASYTFIQIIV